MNSGLTPGHDQPLPATLPRAYFVQWLVLALALLVIGGQIIQGQLSARERMIADANDRLENYSQVVAEELERRLRSTNAVLEQLRDTLPLHADLNQAKSISWQLSTLKLALEGIRTLFVLDANGTLIASNREEFIGKNFAQRAYFQNVRDQPNVDSLYLSDPFITALGVYTVTLSRMIAGPNGEFAGLVSAAIDNESMGGLLQSIHAGNETSLSIVHGAGSLLVIMPQRSSLAPGLSLKQPGSLFNRHMASGQSASLLSGMSISAGTERYISMRTLQPDELHLTTPLIVSAARDQDEVLAPWRLQTEFRCLIFLAFALFASSALYFHQCRQRESDRQIEQAESERRRSMRILQRFIDQLPGTAFVKDADSHTLMANRGFQTLLGIDPASMIGKTTLELFPGEFGRKIAEDDLSVLESGKTVVIEEHFNGRDYESTKFVIDDGSGHHQLGGMTMDITSRKQAERELAKQLDEVRQLNAQLIAVEATLRRLSTAVEQSPASIVITDLQANIIYVNEAFTQTSGYTLDEVQGQNPRILHSGETAPDTYRSLWPTLVSGKVWRGEFINKRKDGSHYLELATISPVREKNGAVTHYVAVKEDITERRRDEIELANHRYHLEKLVELRTSELNLAKQKADSANRAKSDFLANMSHEIRTPMNAIIGIGYLLRQSKLTPDQHEKLNKISNAAEHLLHLINDILDLAKIEAGKVQLERYAFSPAEVLENVGALIRDEVAGKGLRLEIDTDNLPQYVLGDKSRLRQVLLNFAGNAVKFTHQGFVRLSGERLGHEGENVICRFAVTDSGIGIAAEQTGRLFKAFEQLDGSTTRHFGGTGLGLAIATHLAELMGGSIGVDSTPGVGSRFWMTACLGLTQPPETLTLEPPVASNYIQLKGRVLVVEDDPVSREIMEALLAEKGVQAVVAENGLLAVNRVKEADFDLILMDIQMPEMNGLEATRQIRALAQSPATPIVAMTANVFASEQAEYFAAGMIDFLPKPISPQALFALLTKYLPMSEIQPRSADKALVIEEALAPINPTLLSEQLNALSELLGTGNIQANQLFDTLKQVIKHEFPSEYAQLRQQISHFNFEAALPVIERIQERLR